MSVKLNDKNCQREKPKKCILQNLQNPYPIQAAQYLQLRIMNDRYLKMQFEPMQSFSSLMLSEKVR